SHPAVIEARCQHTDIRRVANAVHHNLLQRHFAAATCRDLLLAKAREHPKDVEHRQVNTVGSELAIAREPWLANKCERPGERTLEAHFPSPGHFPQPRITGGRVARIQSAIAIRILGSRAGSAALGVVLADDYGLVSQLGYGGNLCERLIGRPELVGDAHAN